MCGWRSSADKVFQSRGPVTVKLLSPSRLFIRDVIQLHNKVPSVEKSHFMTILLSQHIWNIDMYICASVLTDLDDAGTNEGDGHSDSVDGQLKLEELCDAVVNITSPHHRLDNTCEVIICQYDIGRLLGHVRPSDALSHNTKSIYIHVKAKGKGSPYSYTSVGSGADPGLRHSPAGDIVMAVGCHYFPPRPRLPSKPQSITSI